jgi:hypothetical protein
MIDSIQESEPNNIIELKVHKGRRGKKAVRKVYVDSLNDFAATAINPLHPMAFKRRPHAMPSTDNVIELRRK